MEVLWGVISQIKKAAIADTGYSDLSKEEAAQAAEKGKGVLVAGAKAIVSKVATNCSQQGESEMLIALLTVFDTLDFSEPECAAAQTVAVTTVAVKSIMVDKLTLERAKQAVKEAADSATKLAMPMIEQRKQQARSAQSS